MVFLEQCHPSVIENAVVSAFLAPDLCPSQIQESTTIHKLKPLKMATDTTQVWFFFI